jgi:hypothetical protein
MRREPTMVRFDQELNIDDGLFGVCKWLWLKMSIHAPMLDKMREKVQGKPFTNPNVIDTVREALSRSPTGMNSK